MPLQVAIPANIPEEQVPEDAGQVAQAANQTNHSEEMAGMVAIPIAEKIPNDEDSVGADNELARILAIKGIKNPIFRKTLFSS